MKVGIMSGGDRDQFDDFDVFSFGNGQTLLSYDIVIWQYEFLFYGYSSNRPGDLLKLLRDRRRRLNEFKILMEKGKSLFLMISGLSDSGKFINFDNYPLTPAESELIAKEEIDLKSLNIFSFLPFDLNIHFEEKMIDDYGNDIDYRGDASFHEGWLRLKGKSFYNGYLLDPIWNPFLFVAQTDYVTGAYQKINNGYSFIIPGTQYDDEREYPLFVESTKLLVKNLDKLSERLIEDKWNDENLSEEIVANESYIDSSRIDALREKVNPKFDLAKLICLCEEANLAYDNNAIYSAIMITRAIIDHVPPIFGFSSFSEVANNYQGGKSFKEVMIRLDTVTRKIADMHLHQQIQEKEILPSQKQLNFSPEIDVLLAQILKEI